MNIAMRPILFAILLGVTLLAAEAARGQLETAGLESFAPVDQAFGDLDPLMTSLRRTEVGLNVDGEQTSLFRMDPWVNPGDTFELPTYYRLGPGFRARVNRLDYLVIANPFPIPNVRKSDLGVNVAGLDGLFVEAPAGEVVYDLRPIPIIHEGRLDLSDLMPPYAIYDRPDDRVDRMVDRRRSYQVDRAPVATDDLQAAGLPEALRQPHYRLQQVWPHEMRQTPFAPRRTPMPREDKTDRAEPVDQPDAPEASDHVER